MQFGERLRRERRRRHLSQETLSEVLGCSPKTIRRWENQQAFPQAHHKLQISRFFGIRQEEWFTEDREAIHSASLARPSLRTNVRASLNGRQPLIGRGGFVPSQSLMPLQSARYTL